MKSELLAGLSGHDSSPSVVFGDAEFAVDLVLLFREHEQHDHEHDERALRGHVEAERKAEDRIVILLSGLTNIWMR